MENTKCDMCGGSRVVEAAKVVRDPRMGSTVGWWASVLIPCVKCGLR